jgi:hypothetical protein
MRMNKNIILLKNTNTVVEDKRFPSPDEIMEGELILNYNENVAGLAFKNDSNSLEIFQDERLTNEYIEDNVPKVFISDDVPDQRFVKHGDFWAKPYSATPLEMQVSTQYDNTTAKLPLEGIVNVDIKWGDGTPIEHFNTVTPSHTYERVGVYKISVYGQVQRLDNRNLTDEEKLLFVTFLCWGDEELGLVSTSHAFDGCINLLGETPPDTYKALTNVLDMSYTFYNPELMIELF